jgi:hypothetical protein
VGEGHTSGNRFSVYEAAEVMGITVDAIRKRVARGTILHEKDDDGRVWVILDTDQDTASKVRDTDQPQSDKDALISEMRERVASLERQLESERQANSEHRRLLAAALERIPPQLEPPSESPESDASPTPTDDTLPSPRKGLRGRTGATEKARVA